MRLRCSWLLTVALASSGAMAQETPEEASRRTLLDAAFSIATTGDHARALQLGQQAAQIRMSPSLRLFLAEEHEHLARTPNGEGHIYDATLQSERCVGEAAAQAALNNRERILRDCTALLARMNARVGRIRIAVPPGDIEAAQLTVNGRALTREQWSEPVPVLAGEVTVEARRLDRAPFRRSLRVDVGVNADVAVDFAPIVVTPSAPLVVDTPPAVIARPALAVEAPPASNRTLQIAGLASLGAGVVLGAVGVVQWVRSSGQLGEAQRGEGTDGAAWARYVATVNPDRRLTADQVCDRAGSAGGAPGSDAALAQGLCSGNSTAIATAWALGLGGLALSAVGVTLLVISRAPRARRARLEAAPMVGAGLGGATFRVTF